MQILEYVLMIFIGLLSLPVLVLFLQVLAGKREIVFDAAVNSTRPKTAILMPAHNEELVIEVTLRALLPQLCEDDLLLVVADNCSDRTAELARAFGVKVVERNDEKNRGKGYALDFGMSCLEEDSPPDVVVIVDADCLVAPGAIDTLVKEAMRQNCPVQALYLMNTPESNSLGQAVAEFAWIVKNHVRPLGGSRMGWPCQLMGTGMAFPWLILRKANLAHGNMVEDMKLGVDLALYGHAPVFCPQAIVTSEFPVSEQVIRKQRERWEHGHLATIIAEAPRLFMMALQRRDIFLLAMALDLSVPPLSVLGLALLAMFGVACIIAIVTGSTVSFYWAAGLVSIFAVAALAAWYGFGRNVLAFKTLCAAPFYMFRKIPLYLAFVFKRQQGWVKTERR